MPLYKASVVKRVGKESDAEIFSPAIYLAINTEMLVEPPSCVDPEDPTTAAVLKIGAKLGDKTVVHTLTLSATLNEFVTAINVAESPGVDAGLNDSLTAINALTPAANKFPYFTGAATAALGDMKAWALSLLAQTGAANKLPYFSSAFTMSQADFPSEARAMLAALASQTSKIPYLDGAGVAAVTPIDAGGIALLATADAAEAAAVVTSGIVVLDAVLVAGTKSISVAGTSATATIIPILINQNAGTLGTHFSYSITPTAVVVTSLDASEATETADVGTYKFVVLNT